MYCLCVYSIQEYYNVRYLKVIVKLASFVNVDTQMQVKINTVWAQES